MSRYHVTVPVSRNQISFVLRFFGLLALFYLLVALEPVDRTVVRPFTVGLTAVSAGVLNLFGEGVVRTGMIITGGGFAVDIKNGCNGIEAMVFLCAAMIAFPAPWRARLAGVGIGMVAVQALNVARIVSLFLLGRYRRDLFDMFHLAVWQTVILGAAIFLFVAWTARVRRPDASAAA